MSVLNMATIVLNLESRYQADSTFDGHTIEAFGLVNDSPHRAKNGWIGIYVGKSHTVEKYPLIINGLPYLLNKPGVGHNVEIDLFLVDDRTELPDIDMLEGHPRWYERKRIEVETEKGNVFMPYVYFNDTVEDSGKHHKSYTQNTYMDDWDTRVYNSGYNYGWDYVSEYCECANPEPMRDYDETYCDICYGEISGSIDELETF